eukprot:gene31290-40281_t
MIGNKFLLQWIARAFLDVIVPTVGDIGENLVEHAEYMAVCASEDDFAGFSIDSVSVALDVVLTVARLIFNDTSIVGVPDLVVITGVEDAFEVTEEIGSDLNLKVRLWNDRVEWTKLRNRIMETPIGQLDVQVLERELARYNKTVIMTAKGLPLNKVVPKLKASVDEINPVLPIVTDLRNPCLQPRHWEQITKLI